MLNGSCRKWPIFTGRFRRIGPHWEGIIMKTVEVLEKVKHQEIKPVYALKLRRQYFCFECGIRFWLVDGAHYCPFCGESKVLILPINR